MNKKTILASLAIVMGVVGLSALAPTMAVAASIQADKCACATKCNCVKCQHACDCHDSHSCMSKMAE
ncbi:MAG: hypothetical protein P4M14_04490 [Gammaproteobacteria bacterium]|nr:hypothetical protein [Gammaproteobacteria bacterium]